MAWSVAHFPGGPALGAAVLLLAVGGVYRGELGPGEAPETRPTDAGRVDELVTKAEVEDSRLEGQVDGPLHGMGGGTGFLRPWDVQNGAAVGYLVSVKSTLEYRDLAVANGVITGGDAYQAAGRHLDMSAWGDRCRTVDQNGGEVVVLGRAGSTTYMAAVLQKSEDSNQEVYVSLHGSGVSWLAGERSVAMGYFGEASQSAGRRVWSLELGNSKEDRVILPTDIPVEPGKPVLLVLAIHWDVSGEKGGGTDAKVESGVAGGGGGAGGEGMTHSRVELFVNPLVLGGDSPARADVSKMVPTDKLRAHTVAIYLGDQPGQGAMAGLRLGSSFAAVTPTLGGGNRAP